MVKTLHSFFKKQEISENIERSNSPNKEENVRKTADVDGCEIREFDRPSKCPRIESELIGSENLQLRDFDMKNLEYDPGKRPKIWEYPSEKRDKVRRAYLAKGPHKFKFQDGSYPLNNDKKPRRFCGTWFSIFPGWLEYSPQTDATYCLPCFLFDNPKGNSGSNVFTVQGFKNWKKVNSGKKCSFLTHIGKDHCSFHNIAVQKCEDLLNQSSHIQHSYETHRSEKKLQNRLRLKTSIDSVRWLAFQACAFRGHIESEGSKNRGNFIEMVKILASYNDEVAKVVLENAPYNTKYTSHFIQKEILNVFATKVRTHIRKEIGDAKVCILVDESRDEAKREQMAIVLRFVDVDGFIRERFLDLVHVKDTTSATLKKELCKVFSSHGLDVGSIRGQGYDGASNMRGEWNGLQALFLKDCPYAYFVHCFAHRLQLALVAASRENAKVHEFFANLVFIVNIITSSSKRHDQLQEEKFFQVQHLLELDELETGKGANQIGTLKRAGDTRWSSHFFSICSFIEMFDASFSVLETIINDPKANYRQRGDANIACKYMTSFDFVLILHLMKQIMGITHSLCQALQQRSQDIVNALHLVLSSKVLIQKLRDKGWKDLLEEVKDFCVKHAIKVPDLNIPDCARRGQPKRDMTLEEYYRVDIFFVTIDKELTELNSRFNENSMELLTLCNSLVPKEGFKSFNIDQILRLVEKFYPVDFSNQEKTLLKFQLGHFIIEARSDKELRDLSTIAELCISLAKSEKSKVYFLVDRLIRLILTLPVSTASSERAFSAMKIVKTRLRNKMEDEFLANNLVVYIEKEIAETFDTDSIIEDFKNMKKRRAEF